MVTSGWRTIAEEAGFQTKMSKVLLRKHKEYGFSVALPYIMEELLALKLIDQLIDRCRFILKTKGLAYGRLEIIDEMPLGYKDDILLRIRATLNIEAKNDAVRRLGIMGLLKYIIPNGFVLLL